jgi:hypothetical protein
VGRRRKARGDKAAPHLWTTFSTGTGTFTGWGTVRVVHTSITFSMTRSTGTCTQRSTICSTGTGTRRCTICSTG